MLGTRPFQQYDGPGPSEPTNNGHPTPHFKAGLHQVGAMRADDNRGKGLKFVDSMGNVLGDFGVTGITETRHDIGPACRSGPNFG
ncbi:MAG: phage tail protein [Candidatus Tectomicrobia bacterium]|nr:phage tail protein [Candidatus Tectomicrobia bacterium]